MLDLLCRRRPRALRYFFVIGIVLFVFALAAEAAAEDPRPVIVIVHSDEGALSAGAVREAIARELGGPALSPEEAKSVVTRGTVTVTFRRSRHELAVTYHDEQRGTMSRIVPAPEDAEGAIATAAMLAGNLVRDEAAELLGQEPARPPPLPPLVSHETAPPKPVIVPRPPRRVIAQPPPYLPANASFFYPLATNFGKPNVRTHFDFNLIHGRIGQLEGLQIGFANVVSGSASGGQLGVAFNLARGPLAGFQISPGVNVSSRSTDGLQLSMGLNHTGGAVEGLQLGALNMAGDVRGLQLGLVNVAKKVQGVQLGIINVADDVDGVPVGLVSVTKTGGVHPVVWASNTAYGNVGIQFATRHTYTMVSGSVHLDGDIEQYGPGFALGVRIPLGERSSFDTDVGLTWLFGGPICCERSPIDNDTALTKLRVLGRYSFADRFTLFGGTGITLVTRFTRNGAEATLKLVPEFVAGLAF